MLKPVATEATRTSRICGNSDALAQTVTYTPTSCLCATGRYAGLPCEPPVDAPANPSNPPSPTLFAGSSNDTQPFVDAFAAAENEPSNCEVEGSSTLAPRLAADG